jgi:hypothetical protein
VVLHGVSLIHTALFKAWTLPFQGTHTPSFPWLFLKQRIPSPSWSFPLCFALVIPHLQRHLACSWPFSGPNRGEEGTPLSPVVDSGHTSTVTLSHSLFEACTRILRWILHVQFSRLATHIFWCLARFTLKLEAICSCLQTAWCYMNL